MAAPDLQRYSFGMVTDNPPTDRSPQGRAPHAIDDSGKVVAQHLITDYASDAHERLKHQQQISVNVIRSMMTVNGAAIVGLLTFIGNNKRNLDEGDLRTAFLFFVIGLCFALLSNFGAWATEGSYKDFSQSHSFNYQDLLEGRPMSYLEDSKKEAKRGDTWLGVTIVVLLSSLIAFGLGAFFAVDGIF